MELYRHEHRVIFGTRSNAAELIFIHFKCYLTYEVLSYMYSDVTGAARHLKSRQLACWFNRVFRLTSNKTSKPVTSGIPSQRDSISENVSLSWRHKELVFIHWHNFPCWSHKPGPDIKGFYLPADLSNQFESIKAESRLAPSQWETSLQSNAVSNWLDANLDSALMHASWGIAFDLVPAYYTWRWLRFSYRLFPSGIIGWF